MHRSSFTPSLLAAVLACASPIFVLSQESARVVEEPGSLTSTPAGERVVELAICLDTSGSMDGLINSARTKLWAIVNDLALATPTPRLRVALLTYGNDGHDAENGWVKVETAFTEDLDKVSELLFGLTTNGGTELVGRVVQNAVSTLDWHPSDDTLKMIFVAGNESADQDSVANFRDVCRAAIGRGVMVNSIYCVYSGDDSAVRPGWEEIAKISDGQFSTIDMDNGNVVIATHLDRALLDLSTAVNATYIPFGAGGERAWANQTVQDTNALGANVDAAAQRAATKASALYACSWDLCDATRLEQVDITQVKDEDLPEFMRAMTMEERQQHIADTLAKRAEIQRQIAELSAQRETYMAAELTRRAQTGVDSFDLAVRTAVREQARAKGFGFKPIEPGAADGSTLDYFIQVGPMWVASDIVAPVERAFGEHHGNIPNLAGTFTQGEAECDAILQSLSEPMREALSTLNAFAIIQAEGKLYRIDPKPQPPQEQVEGEGQTVSQVGQSLQSFQVVNASQQRYVPAQTAQQGAVLNLVMSQQQQQQEAAPIEIVPQDYFVQRGDWFIDPSFIDEYERLAAAGTPPAYDETFVNSPEGHDALLKRLSDEQRAAAEPILTKVLSLQHWGGGLIARVDGKLLFLPFDC
jgi:hypothetical protein